MNYNKIFDPPPPDAELPAPRSELIGSRGDRRDGLGYVYSDDIVLKVNVALVTGRPLLVRGPSGAGKSSLASNVANLKQWRYYETVITSRTHARDLLYTFDTLRRLSDAERGRSGAPVPYPDEDDQDPRRLARYVEPSGLWWAMDPISARWRGLEPAYPGITAAQDPNRNPQATSDQAVVLIDEIDKADPDVPNDLLVPFGSLEFRVEELGVDVKPRERRPVPPPPLVIITTNNERELPNAFMRRCLILDLERAGPEMLIKIAIKRFGDEPKDLALYKALAQLMDNRPADNAFSKSPLPSTAEYIDALHACFDLGVKPDRTDPVWQKVEAATLWKPRDSGGA